MKVIVVGAGVLGASTAYHLARDGAAVTLVDRADEGRATSAGAGIVCPWGTRIEDPSAYTLLAGGARYYPHLVAALAEDGEQDLGYRQVGALFVPDDPAELNAAERRVRARAVDAPEAGRIERLSPSQAQALFPPLRKDLPALHVSGGARVNGRLLAAAMSRAAATRGAQVIEGSAELILRGSRAAGVRVDGQVIEADAVVVAAGAWASALLAPAGIQLAVAPQRGQIIHLRLPGTDTTHWPTLQPLSSHYLLAFDDCRVVIGATRELGSGFDYRLTAGGVAEVLNAGLAVAPGLAGWTLHEIRIGFRPLASDNRPMLGPLRGIDNLLIGNGLGASGLTMGPYCGALLARAALGRETEVAFADFDPLRPAAAPTPA
jgi:D-amino-acid dehydrogenase